MSYAISVLKNVSLFDDSWNLYQSLILKIALTEPVTLSTVAQILVSFRSKVEKLKIKSVVESIIKEHTPKGHHYEVAWALWICKEFQIKLPDTIAELIFNSNDVLSILIALDLKNNRLINSSVSTSAVELELTTESLMSEKWLLTYESITHGWLKKSKISIVTDNEYFSILLKHKIQFYDESASIEPLKIKTPLAPVNNFDISKIASNDLPDLDDAKESIIAFDVDY